MVGGQQLGVASQLLNSRPNNGLFLFKSIFRDIFMDKISSVEVYNKRSM